MKLSIKSIIYCQTVLLNHLLLYVIKMASLPSFFHLSKSAKILFRPVPVSVPVSVQMFCHWYRDNSLVRELGVMEAV